MNLYAYVGNDPLNLNDPSGLVADGAGQGFTASYTGNDDGLFNILGNGNAAQKVGGVAGLVGGFVANVGTEVGSYLALDGLLGVGSKVAAEGVATPYGVASQEFSTEALSAQNAVNNGATLFRGGVLGQSAGPEAQFWSLENPLNPGYAEKFGMPAENMNFDFIETGTLNPGTNFITRAAPGIGGNGGGAIEVVTPPGGVTLNLFSMP